MILISFYFFMVLFFAVGALSYFKNKHTSEDYLIASHNISPLVVAISAVATNNSGYMFIGMIGFTYLYGITSIWMMMGWIFGDFLISFFVHEKLRQKSVVTKAHSYPGLLSTWQGKSMPTLRLIAGLVTITFVGVYAAAQLKAGGKALNILFGFHENIGALLGTILILGYSIIGGIRASFWTDVAQAIVMLFGMLLLVVYGLIEIGGFQQLIDQLQTLPSDYLSLFSTELISGHHINKVLFITGWLFAGFGVVGQPHIMVRFVVLKSVKYFSLVRLYYYVWYFTFYSLTIFAGLLCKVLITESANFDPEIALPLIAVKLLPSIFAGVVIASIFAATMSTADSQVIACVASISEDFGKKFKNYYLLKVFTFFITLIILSIAVIGNESVFILVVFAWSALASAFTPLIFLLSLGKKIPESVAIIMVITGLSTAIIFKVLFDEVIIYEAAPGILMGFIPYFLSKYFYAHLYQRS